MGVGRTSVGFRAIEWGLLLLLLVVVVVVVLLLARMCVGLVGLEGVDGGGV